MALIPSKLVAAMVSVRFSVLLPPMPSIMGRRPLTVSTINSRTAARSLSVMVAASLVVPRATM